MHRSGADPDAGVTFAVNLDTSNFTGEPGKVFTPLVTIPRNELRQWFPELVEQLAEDSYFSINSFWIARDKRTKKARPSLVPEFEHLPYPAQRADRATRLNACYADLDIYKVAGLDPEAALAAVMRMAREGAIPEPSLYVDSGRGLWPLWLLRDNRNPNESPPAFDSLKKLYQRINRAITLRLKALGSDFQANDVSRFLRVPGSINSKGKKRVAYLLPLGADGKPFTYTLEELAEFFGLKRPRITAATRGLAEGDTSAKLKGQRGTLGRWTRELQRFEQLRALRAENPPAFPKGQRSRALWFYASLLVRVRSSSRVRQARGEALTPEQIPVAMMSDADIRTAVRSLVRECAHDASDPIRPTDADAAVRAALSKGGIGGEFSAKHQTIANWFRITPEEACELPRSGRQRFPHHEGADTSRTLPDVPTTRATESRARQSFILRVAQEAKKDGLPIPTFRRLNSLLKPLGLDASERTIMKDLARLGIENPRSRAAKRAERERAAAEATPLLAGLETHHGPAPGPAPFGTSTDANQAPNPERKTEASSGAPSAP